MKYWLGTRGHVGSFMCYFIYTHSNLEKLLFSLFYGWGSPAGTVGEEAACQYRRHKRHKRYRFDPWVGEIPWSRKGQPTLVFLPEWLQRVGHDWACTGWLAGCFMDEEIETHVKNLSRTTQLLSDWATVFCFLFFLLRYYVLRLFFFF